MTKQNNIPELRFSEFEREWVEKRIIDFAPLQRGFDLPVNDIKEGNFPVVFSNGILKYHNEYKVKAPGVVTGRSGTIGKVTFVENDFWPHNTSLWVTKFINSDPTFVYYFYTYFKLERFGSGSGVPTLNRNDVHIQKVSIPTLCEQQKIASFFMAIDSKLDLLRKKRDLLEKYKKGVMQKIFSQEIRFKDENGNDYADWVEKKLGDVGETYNGLTGKTKENFGTGKPYVQYKQIFDCSKIDPSRFGFVEICENEKQNTVTFGDVFFTISSETSAEIGTASVLLDEVEELYLNSFCFGYRLNQNVMSPYFARYMFRSEIFRKEIIKLAQGSTRYNMSKTELLKLQINLPSLPEQEKIANFLSSIDTKIENLVIEIEGFEKWKKGLLGRMFC